MSATSDSIRIRHMLESAREALFFAEGKTRQDLDHDRLLVLGLIKAVEIVGEAASKVTKEYQRKHPEIEWAAIIAMRNILIHVYFGIDLDEVWNTLQNDLPDLIIKLESLVQD